ncbi:hypothetical protein FGIG_07278 [Fasciola gigantica]|uniref:Uncharacterized protein n=1 Tax=Fasciola gigantica TaxID=46835 RepID=A0A504WTJ4_FASGI|nr:hypothetical protein FGIG_07278 [Fasciola gigantica]
MSACVLFLAIFAWSSYLFHSAMIITQLLAIAWNGACYYLDVYPVEIQRNNNLQLRSATAGDTATVGAANSVHRTRSTSSLPDAKNDDDWSSSDRSPNDDSPTCTSSLLLPTDVVLEVQSSNAKNVPV